VWKKDDIVAPVIVPLVYLGKVEDMASPALFPDAPAVNPYASLGLVPTLEVPHVIVFVVILSGAPMAKSKTLRRAVVLSGNIPGVAVECEFAYNCTVNLLAPEFEV
jgi:hypothetical protein